MNDIPAGQIERGANAAAPGSGAPAAQASRLRKGSLGLGAIISQSVANISPTFTPALNIAVVASIAGAGSWITYLLATAAMLLVAYNIAVLARRHLLAGSYFVYIGRNLGSTLGVLAGWTMIGTYIWTAATVVLGGAIFLSDLLGAVALGWLMPPPWLFILIFCGALAWSAVRDIHMSARIGLILEGTSILIVLAIVAAAVIGTGRLADPVQLDLADISPGPILTALVFATFSFVGFESAATMAKETRDAERNIPRALLLSVVLCGLFFVSMAYGIRLVVGEETGADGNLFTLMTRKAGLAWTAGLVYFGALISAFACALASVNAASRLIFSMGRYGLLHAAAGRIHVRHNTPHVAALTATAAAGVISLATLPAGLFDAYTWVATITAFGFLSIYGLICVAAPVESFRARQLGAVGVIAGCFGIALVLVIFATTLSSTSSYPLNLIPLLFIVYVAIGLAWCLRLRKRWPERMASLQHDLEE